MHRLLAGLIVIVFVAGCGKSPETADSEKPSSPNSSTAANKKDPKQALVNKPTQKGSLEERKSFQSLESKLGNAPFRQTRRRTPRSRSRRCWELGTWLNR
jgi:hypothetical protein